MVKAKQDLTGKTFGRLTVINQAEDYINSNGIHLQNWKCRCDCGKIIEVLGVRLKNGNTKSCGCLRSDLVAKKNSKINDHEIYSDYVIIYTSKQEPIYVDLEDYEKIKNVCWHIDHVGYVVGHINHKKVYLHRIIMNCPCNMVVDHINHKPTDNRKSNLRIATPSENNQNQGLRQNNSSGVTGITWHKASKKWRVRIVINNQEIYLGIYDDFEEAVKVRREAEEKYFGEWSYSNSQKMNNNLSIKESI